MFPGRHLDWQPALSGAATLSLNAAATAKMDPPASPDQPATPLFGSDNLVMSHNRRHA